MALRKLQNFIGGGYRDAADGRTATLVNPSTGQDFAEAPLSGQADVDAAMQAAQDLGANPWTTFRKITLPLLAPGIMAGALLAFALSIDDYVVTSFVNGQVETFPLWVYGATRVGVPPQVNVMGTLIFLGGAAIAVGNALLARRQRA